MTLPAAQPKSPTSPVSALRRSQPPDHLATLFMLGAAPEHLPPPMLPVSSGGDHGPATDGSGGGGDGGGGGGDGIPLHPELRLGGAWRGRRRHFSFRCRRRWGDVECVCAPHAHRTATACTALHTAQHVHVHVHVHVRVHAHVRTCRYNLMEHVGAVSTLRDEPHPESLPRCNDFLGASAPLQPTHCLECRRRTLYACLGLPFGSEGELRRRQSRRLRRLLPLGVPALFLEECFHLGHCPEDDLWPCDSPNASLAPSLPRLVSDWGALCGFHQMLL